ncbi:MAG TPA: BREX-1 system phosphatase PglZ type A [Treponema sp.]|nr:BREX-1 system phosphatase PglZ type A [Treponema sp.]
MSQRIYEALDRLFLKNRIIFWYDPEGRMLEIFQSYQRDSVQTMTLSNNEFYIKYLLIREKPQQKFLLYAPTKQPPITENWLLDLELEHVVFSADEASMYIQDLGLSDLLKQAVSLRLGFFRDQKNRFEPLQALARPDWTEDDLLYAMLSIVSSETKKERQKLRPLDEIVISLCAADDEQQKWKQVQEWQLTDIFFRSVKKEYGIELEKPEPRGVLLRLFQYALEFQSGKDHSAKAQRAYIFIDSWRDSREETVRFENCSRTLTKELNIQNYVATLPLEQLLKIDIYEVVDHIVLHRIIEELLKNTADIEKCLNQITERKNLYWYRNDQEEALKAKYDALETYCLFERHLRQTRVERGFAVTTKDQLWDRYCNELYKIDQLYRRFVYAYQKAGSSGTLAELYKKIDARYLEGYLEPLARKWQTYLDADNSLGFAKRQHTFFTTFVDPYLREQIKLFVIISDGLRWEAGQELCQRLIEKGRLKVELEPLAALIPTYTAHGMAALLPHTRLSLQPETGKVTIDGIPVEGVDGRNTFLGRVVSERYQGKTACAIQANDFLAWSASDVEERLKTFDLVYIYSDRIDATGHDSDEAVPAVVTEELKRLIDMVRKITNMDRSNILITADHGFLYSGDTFEEPYMLSLDTLPGELYRDRRFILGNNVQEISGLCRYDAKEPAISGNSTALVAKGLLRIRKKGPLTRYVHGGTTLQELVVPLIKIKKIRSDETRRVEVSVLGSNDITSPSVTLKFYQEEPIGGLILAHRILSYFVSESGEIISNKIDRTFDSTDMEDMNRGVALSFSFLSVAKQFVGSSIVLKLETLAEGGTPILYKTFTFRLKRLVMDVDFL